MSKAHFWVLEMEWCPRENSKSIRGFHIALCFGTTHQRKIIKDKFLGYY